MEGQKEARRKRHWAYKPLCSDGPVRLSLVNWIWTPILNFEIIFISLDLCCAYNILKYSTKSTFKNDIFLIFNPPYCTTGMVLCGLCGVVWFCMVLHVFFVVLYIPIQFCFGVKLQSKSSQTRSWLCFTPVTTRTTRTRRTSWGWAVPSSGKLKLPNSLNLAIH